MIPRKRDREREEEGKRGREAEREGWREKKEKKCQRGKWKRCTDSVTPRQEETTRSKGKGKRALKRK